RNRDVRLDVNHDVESVNKSLVQSVYVVAFLWRILSSDDALKIWKNLSVDGTELHEFKNSVKHLWVRTVQLVKDDDLRLVNAVRTDVDQCLGTVRHIGRNRNTNEVGPWVHGGCRVVCYGIAQLLCGLGQYCRLTGAVLTL